MKPRFSHLFWFVVLAVPVVLLVMFISVDRTLADANVPTETNTPAPTETFTPQPTAIPPTDIPLASSTSIPLPAESSLEGSDSGFALATPLSPAPSQGLSMIDRILLVLLAIAVVIVIGVIVYLVYYQTRGGLEER